MQTGPGGVGAPVCRGVLVCQGTGQLFRKVERVPEATSHPPVHVLLRAHPPTPLSPGGVSAITVQKS